MEGPITLYTGKSISETITIPEGISKVFVVCNPIPDKFAYDILFHEAKGSDTITAGEYDNGCLVKLPVNCASIQFEAPFVDETNEVVTILYELR